MYIYVSLGSLIGERAACVQVQLPLKAQAVLPPEVCGAQRQRKNRKHPIDDPGAAEATQDETLRVVVIGSANGAVGDAGTGLRIRFEVQAEWAGSGSVLLGQGIRLQNNGQLKRRATGRLRMHGLD